MAGRGRPRKKPAAAAGDPKPDEKIPEVHDAQELRNAIPPSSTPPQQQQIQQPEQAAPANAATVPPEAPAPPSNARDPFFTPENIAMYGETLVHPITAETIKDLNQLNEK